MRIVLSNKRPTAPNQTEASILVSRRSWDQIRTGPECVDPTVRPGVRLIVEISQKEAALITGPAKGLFGIPLTRGQGRLCQHRPGRGWRSSTLDSRCTALKRRPPILAAPSSVLARGWCAGRPGRRTRCRRGADGSICSNTKTTDAQTGGPCDPSTRQFAPVVGYLCRCPRKPRRRGVELQAG